MVFKTDMSHRTYSRIFKLNLDVSLISFVTNIVFGQDPNETVHHRPALDYPWNNAVYTSQLLGFDIRTHNFVKYNSIRHHDLL